MSTWARIGNGERGRIFDGTRPDGTRSAAAAGALFAVVGPGEDGGARWVLSENDGFGRWDIVASGRRFTLAAARRAAEEAAGRWQEPAALRGAEVAL